MFVTMVDSLCHIYIGHSPFSEFHLLKFDPDHYH